MFTGTANVWADSRNQSSEPLANLPNDATHQPLNLRQINFMTFKKLRSLVLLTVSGMLLVGCSTPRSPAPVTERGTASRPVEASRSASGAVSQPRAVDARGNYTVRRGDTLAHIATEFGQNYRDLVIWNNLTNANDIKVDQVLRVIPPEAGAGTPQTASVTTSSGVEVRPLGTAASTGTVVAAPAPSVATVPNKNGPRGDKRPYSDAALAELQRPESSNNTTVPAAAAASVARPGEARSTDKTTSMASTTPMPSATTVTPPAPGSMPPGTPTSAEDDNISWMWPTEGRVASGFDDGKKGIDIIGRSGQQVLAASAGKVMYAGSGMRGYGNLVIVRHTSNLLSAYAHNKTILVKEGQNVIKGQKIAEMGNSDSDLVKLHFEIRQQGKPVDPSKYLPVR